MSADASQAARLPAEVTAGNAIAALGQALAALEAARAVFDLTDCRHFDSSLVSVMLELKRRASAGGRRCTFVGASPDLRKLCGLYGVEGLLFGAQAEHDAAPARPGT